MTTLELDPQFTQGLRLLHSTYKDSAEQLRTLLDEAIKLKCGPAKMLSNVLHKKQYMMEEPVLSDHSSSSSKKSKNSSSKHSNKSSKNSSPINLPARDTPPDILQSDDNLALEILEDDLTCVVCKGMDIGARNILVECVECHSLYHQECHTPHILDLQIDVPRIIWYCSNCTKSQTVKESARSSPKSVTDKPKDQKKFNTKGSGERPKITPNIQIISADKRLKEMMNKAKQEKRSSSSSSSNKHSSSSSSSKSSQEKSLMYKMKSTAD